MDIDLWIVYVINMFDSKGSELELSFMWHHVRTCPQRISHVVNELGSNPGS